MQHTIGGISASSEFDLSDGSVSDISDDEDTYEDNVSFEHPIPMQVVNFKPSSKRRDSLGLSYSFQDPVDCTLVPTNIPAERPSSKDQSTKLVTSKGIQNASLRGSEEVSTKRVKNSGSESFTGNSLIQRRRMLKQQRSLHNSHSPDRLDSVKSNAADRSAKMDNNKTNRVNSKGVSKSGIKAPSTRSKNRVNPQTDPYNTSNPNAASRTPLNASYMKRKPHVETMPTEILKNDDDDGPTDDALYPQSYADLHRNKVAEAHDMPLSYFEMYRQNVNREDGNQAVLDSDSESSDLSPLEDEEEERLLASLSRLNVQLQHLSTTSQDANQNIQRKQGHGESSSKDNHGTTHEYQQSATAMSKTQPKTIDTHLHPVKKSQGSTGIPSMRSRRRGNVPMTQTLETPTEGDRVDRVVRQKGFAHLLR